MFKKRFSPVLILALTLSILAASMLTACKNRDSQKPDSENTKATTPESVKQDVKIAALKGATAIGLVKLMSDADAGNTANNYSISLHGTADEITTALVKGELDMACLPCNAASVLYNKTEGKIQMAAINTLGVLYIVETGNSINSVNDLKGKTIYTTGQGTTPEYTLRYLLSSNGINPDTDVTIEFKSEAAEVATILSDASDAVAMLPQPYVASAMMKNDKLRMALSVTDEWEKTKESNGSTVVTGVLVVRKEYADKNPDVVKAFLSEYEASINYVNTNTDDCAALLEKYDIFKAAVAKNALPYCNVKYISGNEMKNKATGYLKALFEQNPSSIGGKMPEDDFFYGIK